MTREELFFRLSETTKDGPSAAHEQAEDILLEYIEDDDLSLVWDELSDDWWYS